MDQFGLSICYDLRFPELYRSLQEKGANVLLIPSAFTQHTGEAHWHILLRSRAIEFQSWVIAAAQTGTHDVEGTRQSYGHALIIDPWGRVIGDAPERRRVHHGRYRFGSSVECTCVDACGDPQKNVVLDIDICVSFNNLNRLYERKKVHIHQPVSELCMSCRIVVVL